MNNSANEKLRKLLAGFMDESAARQAAEDIEKGDEIMRAYSAPQPEERVLAEVKRNVVAALRQRRTVVFQRNILTAAVAAAVIAVSVLALIRYENTHSNNQIKVIAASIPARVWEGADDADVTVLKAEIENIQSELAEAQSDDIPASGSTTVGELETELIEINGDMWKG
jgi:hypothetical protein